MYSEVKAMSAMEFKHLGFELKGFDSEQLIIEHIISSQRRDRGGDCLYAGANSEGKGMITDGGNISILHSHGYGVMGSEPIGKNLGLQVIEFKGFPAVLAKTQFFPDETGKRIFAKMTGGYAPSASVGWQPIIWQNKSEANGESTRHCYEWLLLEYSVGLGVPMQPDAIFPGEKLEEGVLFKMMPREKKTLPVFCRNKSGQLLPLDEAITEIMHNLIRSEIRTLRGKVE